MQFPKRYKSKIVEEKLQNIWEERNIFQFSFEDSRPVYAIDTPPPTVSGDLHLGHCYSYSQTDFMARFWRMSGYNVFYPMGWDDNGLPTERLVEKRLGIKPIQVGREKFIEAIQEVSQDLESDYKSLWKRLGLSVDWGYTYATISPESRKVSQYSFIDLYNKDLAHRVSAPSIWCPTCGTAIAQAEVDDLERETNFITMAFKLDDGQILPIATTRPELLPACVAVFVNPNDEKHRDLVGKTAITPIFGKEVPIIADHKADPEKGTGVVMCCTFGDTTDVEWWYTYKLPLIAVVNRDGKLNELSGPYAGLKVTAAREKIITDLAEQGLLLDTKKTPQTVRVHERCDTPVEYIEAKQWFIKLLEHKDKFLEAGKSITWHPAHFHNRYENWVQNLGWDWCISRQRYYGVPFPIWYSKRDGEEGKILVAHPDDLPIDPAVDTPRGYSRDEVEAETDVMDTWATSSVSPQVAGRWLENKELFEKLFPMSLRPHSHEIIRTWTFYTIVKSLYHFGKIPWANIAISGWGILPAGGKVSKSRGGGPIDPMSMMDKYSVDAVRYWSASTKLGRDAVINEEKIAIGNKLVTKIWNVARFALGFLEEYQPSQDVPSLLPLDRWLLSRLQHTIEKATVSFRDYDYTSAKDDVESYFWNVLADNYLEMVKTRLYELGDNEPAKLAAKYSLYNALLAIIKMLAPIMPYITEEIFQIYYAQHEPEVSLHISKWPEVSSPLIDESVELFGNAIVGIATEVRRYKSTNQISMGTPLTRLQIFSSNQELISDLKASILDITSVTRAQNIEFGDIPPVEALAVSEVENMWVTIEQ
ncbi:MAG: valine--tRNA ligase [Caldilineaceae bacterium]|nr:valine--tRNA ligase [Caldilineaceae bacterium]